MHEWMKYLHIIIIIIIFIYLFNYYHNIGFDYWFLCAILNILNLPV